MEDSLNLSLREILPAVQRLAAPATSNGNSKTDTLDAQAGGAVQLSLAPIGGAPFSLDASLDTVGVVDGDLLALQPVPTGPACCYYNGCHGDTIPYFAIPAPRVSPKAVLAVWPETADVDLRPRPHGGDRGEIPDSPWPGTPGASVEQGVRAGAHRLIAGCPHPSCRSGAELWTDFHMLCRADIVAAANSTFSKGAAMLNERAGTFMRPDRARAALVPFDPWDAPENSGL